MRILPLLSPARAGALIALLLVLGGGAGLWGDQGRPERVERIPVLLFGVAFENAPPSAGPDTKALALLVSEQLDAGLRAGGYEPSALNPESPSVRRAVEREHKLTAEDLAHPDQEASARRIAVALGVRYVLFPRLPEIALDLDAAEARMVVALRVVPGAGPEREARGTGSARAKPDKRSRTLATRLLGQAADAAVREVVRQIAPPLAEVALAKQENQADAFYAQALAQMKGDHPELAIPLLERATRLDPRRPDFAIALGDAYARNRQSANALMEFHRAVTLQPTSADLRVRLAKVYLQRNMVREAAAELLRASRLAPEHEGVRAALMDLYLGNGMLEEALVEYRRMAAARPNDAGIRMDLGDLLVRRGSADEALEEYAKAAALDARNPVPHEKRAALYRRRGLHREALTEMLLAQRTPAGADDVRRYQDIARALDGEASALLAEAARTKAARKDATMTREDAYTAIKALAGRADALAAEMLNLKAPAAVDDSHRRRVLAYSLLTQSLYAYVSFYETDRAEDGGSADLLASQAGKEIQRAQGP